MAYIARDDGEHYVVPSYRDILSAKNPSLLKKEILLLSGNYGNYITLLRKNQYQYEAAFSGEPGYLLGESVWQYFKRPTDLIYCEALPGTLDALLVIVKAGSVYLDGTFPIDSIADELVVFKSQSGNFEIYIHGEIPISEQPEEGKFSLNASSVKSFTQLAEPLFPVLPKYNEYKLILAETLLASMGIGVFPVKKVAMIVGIPLFLIVCVMLYKPQREVATHYIVATMVKNPWDDYYQALNSTPAPNVEVHNLLNQLIRLYTAPGWNTDHIQYSSGTLTANLNSAGMKTAPLLAWATKNKIDLQIAPDGMHISTDVTSPNRHTVTNYSDLKEVTSSIIDRSSSVLTGITLSMGDSSQQGPYRTLKMSISFMNTSIQTLNLLGDQFDGLPVILSSADITMDQTTGSLSGKFVFQALGV